MGVEINVDETPALEAGDEEGNEWQSRLLEILTAGLESGFSAVRQEFRLELETLRQSNSDLLSANTQLTQQITMMNQTLMDRLPALTPAPLEPVVVIVPEPVPERNADESLEVETSKVPVPEVTHRKRRLL